MANQLGDGQPAAIGDNSRGVEEGEKVQLLSFVSKLNTANAEVEKAKAPFDAAKKARTQLFRLAKSAGFQRQHLEDYLDRMSDGTRDNVADEVRRRKHYKWLGIVDDESIATMEGAETPAEAKDEFHHGAEGYKAGLRGLPAKPPQEVPERFVQAWMNGHARGTAESLEAIAAIAPKLTGGKPKAADKAKAVGEQAKADFAADEAAQAALSDEDIKAAAAKQAKDWGVDGKPGNKPVNLAK